MHHRHVLLKTMAADGEKRCLVLTADDRQVIVGRLARAVLRFQDDFLSRETSPAGLLCQVWLPEVVEDNAIVLKTKGMPFCVAGMGDLLALFRCISCRFAFGTNVHRPNTLGAPGRVFTSSEPEMCCNVQQYAKGAYLRKAEAEQCQVQSTLLLPLFISPRRSGCVGVLEVVQTSEDMAFVDVAALLASALERCELYTCTMDDVRRHTPTAATVTTAVLLPPQTGVLVPPVSDESGPQGSGGGGGGGEEALAAGAAAPMGGMQAADSDEFSADEGDEMDEDDDEDFGEASTRKGGASRVGGAATGGKGGGAGGGHKPRRKGVGNPGKPGVRLTLADLQSQFGVGLKEAATRLGICPTTLKRACRRHGIQRWPRRQLQKVNKALDELEARQMMRPQQHLAPPPPLGGGGGMDPFGGGFPAADNRWMTLSQLIPAYHSGSGLLAFNNDSTAHMQGLLSFRGGMLPVPQQAQQQLLLQQQAAQVQALASAAVAGGGGGRQGAPTPPMSHVSLPDGALAMGAGMARPAMQEVSTVSGVSTLGQPPPRRSLDSTQQQQQRLQQQQVTTGAGPAHHQQQQQRQGGGTGGGAATLSGSSSGGGGGGQGAPLAAEYLQRVAATANYVSPFGPAATTAANAPIVRLPNSFAAAAGAAGGHTTLSAISVPSLGLDVMPPLSDSGGGGGGGGTTLTDDEQVGFVDSTVLELLLNEEARGTHLPLGAWRQGQGVPPAGSNGVSKAAPQAAPAAGAAQQAAAAQPAAAGATPALSAGELLPSLLLPDTHNFSALLNTPSLNFGLS